MKPLKSISALDASRTNKDLTIVADDERRGGREL